MEEGERNVVRLKLMGNSSVIPIGDEHAVVVRLILCTKWYLYIVFFKKATETKAINTNYKSHQ